MKKINLIVTLSIVIICSCKTNRDSKEVKEVKEVTSSYPETVLTDDTTKLWVADGDSSKDTVAIFLQGGPKDELSFVSQGKSSWRYLPNFKDYYQIYLHQSNTLNSEMFRYDGDFTMKMARKEVDNSSEILYRAIKHFKEKGKTVWVFGHSYGTFIITHYLATRESLADKYIFTSGRIDDPKYVVNFHKKGLNGYYENGTTFISDEGKDFSNYNEDAKKYYLGKQRLKAAIGELSYSELLKSVNLNNSIYVYNPKDERVGGLTNEEINFLKDKGVQVYKTHYEHGNTIYGLVDGINEGKIKL